MQMAQGLHPNTHSSPRSTSSGGSGKHVGSNNISSRRSVSTYQRLQQLAKVVSTFSVPQTLFNELGVHENSKPLVLQNVQPCAVVVKVVTVVVVVEVVIVVVVVVVVVVAVAIAIAVAVAVVTRCQPYRARRPWSASASRKARRPRNRRRP